MTIVRVGATKKYTEGWEAAFSGGKRKAAGATATKSSAAKKSAAKASTKKKASGKKAKKKK